MASDDGDPRAARRVSYLEAVAKLRTAAADAKTPEAREQLAMLADLYERLASELVQAAADPPSDPGSPDGDSPDPEMPGDR